MSDVSPRSVFVERVASLDIGTNSVRLLIADIDGEGGTSVALRKGEVTRLGEGLEETGRISIDARDRTARAITNFVKEARKRGASRIILAGTGALRSAENGVTTAEHFSSLTGLPLKILSGEEEARLVFRAVGCPAEQGETNCMVLDIGGGSTELILGRRGNVVSWNSTELGCVRLTERVFKKDPPSRHELDKAEQEVGKALSSIQSAPPGSHLHCVGGTITTFASVEKRLARYDPGRIEGFRMNRDSAERIVKELACMSTQERVKVPGISPGRADIIVAGGLILCGALKRLGFKEFAVSTKGLRYGLLALA